MKVNAGIIKIGCIAGLVLSIAVAGLHAGGWFSNQVYMMLHGACNLIFVMGLVFWIRRALEDSDPSIKKLNEIENKDERNILIKQKASSMAGDILQWMLLIMSLILIGAGVPIWVAFVLMGLVMVKLFIEFCFSIYYQDKY